MPVQEQSRAEAVLREEAPSKVSIAPGTRVALLTGGIDRPYAFGITLALGSQGILLDVLGNNELDSPEFRQLPSVRFLKPYIDMRERARRPSRLLRHFLVYVRLFRYAVSSKARIFHILWNYKLEPFDRTIFTMFFKLLGKKIVLTAHNVNTAARDRKDSLLNRVTLEFQYRCCDRIFVHTEAMRDELLRNFKITPSVVVTIPFGVNNSVPDTSLTSAEAKLKLGLEPSHKAILFFGRIREYKGLHYLVQAFKALASADPNYRLIIAGEPKKDAAAYWQGICQQVADAELTKQAIVEARFIRDDETELYFKAADVAVLPYADVFQSGVLFLAYSFGLPVIASNVGSLRADIIEGETGYVCRSKDVEDLEDKIRTYFDSDLYKSHSSRRADIRALVTKRNSWNSVADVTIKSYNDLVIRK
jgi:D-inositol-3-phosphate glycosyltransferase